VTIEEQKLSEMLHRLTPEPPRPVTVEDVAIRLANKNAPARGAGKGVTGMSGGGDPSGFAGSGGRRMRRGRFTPLLAAAAVVVIAGAGAGVAVALSSNSSGTTPRLSAGGQLPSANRQAATSTPSPVQSASTTPASEPVASGAPVTNGAWGASVVAPVTLTAGTLVSSGNSLYAFSASNLLEIDPSTGQTTHEAPSDGFPGQAPVIAGGKVWEVTSYAGGVGLSGYSLQTLAAGGTISVPGSGTAAGNPDGILTAGPDGDLYVAAGNTIDVVNPSSGSVIRRFTVPGGAADSVAVSPDGSRIYASVGNRLVELNGSTGATIASVSTGAQEDGSLVATSGGVWFTTSGGMAERIWFAPAGNLPGAQLVAGPSVGGNQAVPTYVDGVVWIGGTKKVECLDPDTGQVRASSLVPSDDQVPEGIGDVATAGGHVFALYVNNRTEQGGVAVLRPPAACAAGGSSSGGTGS
jgi:hypothetical protein